MQPTGATLVDDREPTGAAMIAAVWRDEECPADLACDRARALASKG
jgi:hypothetical protein